MFRGPLLWGAFLLVGYLAAEAGCTTSISTARGTKTGVLLLAAATAILCFGAAFGSYRRWRDNSTREWDESWIAYSEPAGSLFALTSAAAILVTALSTIGLATCR